MGEHYSELSALAGAGAEPLARSCALRASQRWPRRGGARARPGARRAASGRPGGLRADCAVAARRVAALACVVSRSSLRPARAARPADRALHRGMLPRARRRRWSTAIAERGASEPHPMADASSDDAVRRTRGVDLDRIVSRRALRGVGLRGRGHACVGDPGVFSVGPAGARRASLRSICSLTARARRRARRCEGARRRAAEDRGDAHWWRAGGPVPVLKTGDGAETRMEADRTALPSRSRTSTRASRISIAAAGTTTR